MSSSASHIPAVSQRSMSSSLSPDRGDGGSGAMTSEGEDKAGSSGPDLSIFQALNDKRTTREGNPPKKRGPKPNSKPALTRRQELNRQAQRTHRERKELYIKALEDEVLRLKEIFSNVSLDRERLAEENRHLRDALVDNGIPFGSPGSGTSHAPGSSAFTPPMTTHSTTPSMTSSSHVPPADRQHQIGGHQLRDMAQPASGGGMDVEQAGIDFVLTYDNFPSKSEAYLSSHPHLEEPCKAHLQFLLERKDEPGGEPCGHALMASCPPEPFPESRPDLPFGHAHLQGDAVWGHGTWQPTKADLSTLLDLSKKLDLDGEVTPVMAWGMLLAHPRAQELGVQDFQRLTDELVRKVRCYGFGAVMEEFEVRDALDSLFTWQPAMVVG
ncbi:hypothetical protein G7Z17_g11911 [Cylindrodendrum hubeiense]|uniref:Uncharacterized protein n=1 Tax=Cylindrodendrum hubeiense TaxID=595255 RepID=A0A9P5H038_9HYPO|nr:hypothetical protein G7Z17_g11911 [Cylindrodendrum hubeiense]